VSLRQRLLNAVLRATVKPRLSRLADPAAARREFEMFGRVFLRGLRLLRDRATALPVAGGPLRDRAVLWFHGGAYIAGSPVTHRGLAGRLARAAGVPVVLPDYRLAPLHPLPAAMEDARAAWDALLAAGVPAGRIVLGGDSAGGGMALSLLSDLCRAATPPAGCIAVSPFCDLTGSGASLHLNAAADPMLPGHRLPDLLRFILGTCAPDDPRVSPLFADFPGCPPVLIQHSRTEILRDDAVRMAARLRAFGGAVTLQDWPDTPHAWPVFGDGLPESRAAVAQTGALARARLTPGSPSQ
jgi:acetyl esterase/lipase